MAELEVWVMDDGAEWVRTGPDEWTGGPLTVEGDTVLSNAAFRAMAATHDVTVETRTEV